MENKKTEKPLRIGIDGRVMQEKNPSGIPLYAINIVNEISKIDSYNKYIIFYNSFKKIENNIPRFEKNIDERIFHFPNKFLEWFWKFLPFPKIDKILDVDIFFSPHFINIPLSKKVKKIITIHDLSFLKNKKYFSFRKNLWHWQMNPKSSCKKFDKIIAVSENTKKDLKDIYNINESKIKVIYNGFDSYKKEVSKIKEKDILDKFNIGSKEYILFLATLEPRKNIEGIIDSFAKIYSQNKSIKLVIAGKKGWLFEKIFKKVSKYNLDKNIVFTGFINKEEKHILLKNALFFVFPSFCEGFGLPLIEARNYNLPIITSSTSSVPEIVKDGSILINPHNTYDLSVAMKKILENKSMFNILVKKSKKIKNNNWNNSAKETLEYILS